MNAKMNAKSKPPRGTGRSTAPIIVEHRADRAPRVRRELLIPVESQGPSAVPAQAAGDRPGIRIARWSASCVGLFLIAIFVVSFFMDSIVRSRLERTINSSLSGYHAILPSA